MNINENLIRNSQKKYPGLEPIEDYTKKASFESQLIVLEDTKFKETLNECACNICYGIPFV